MNVDMRTAKQHSAEATPGFAIQLLGDTDLGNAMLIAEDQDGHYEPIALAVNINEGKELAQSDLWNRMRAVESNLDSNVLCPWQYKLWARGLDGHQRIAAAWILTDL